METMRDINRVMQREIAKGSCPLTLERIVFGETPYQQIRTMEKLDEVLSYLLRLGEYKQYATKTITNNIYMDLDMLLRKVQFQRTYSIIEREDIFRRIQKYRNKLKPDYDGKLYLETVQCIFSLPKEHKENYRFQYQGKDTYGFLMSNKYMLGLFTYCEATRKAMVENEDLFIHMPEQEQKMAKLIGVRDVLFQALLLDSIVMEEDMFRAEMCTILLLE